MRLHLIRHPRPAIATGICYGSSDIAVGAAEQEQALKQLGPRLPAGVPLYSSPLLRCADFAARLASEQGCELRLDARLMELHFGTWELCSWEDIPRAEIDAWAADVTRHAPGGGESLRQMAGRVQAFYGELSQSERGEAIVVCHAGTIRLLLACTTETTLDAIARAAAGQKRSLDFAELLSLDL